jgi:hypothetical protein
LQLQSEAGCREKKIMEMRSYRPTLSNARTFHDNDPAETTVSKDFAKRVMKDATAEPADPC